MNKGWLCSIAVTLVVLGAAADGGAQSIQESVLKLSTADGPMRLDAKQWSFKTPPRQRSASLGKRVLMGTVIGAVGGMIAGIPLYRYCSSEGGSDCRYTVLYTGAIGAAVGAAVGARR